MTWCRTRTYSSSSIERYALRVILERARPAHATVALVATFTLLLQLVLVVQGSAVLVEEDPPGLVTRLGRLVSYFTIQSNLLVAVASVMLARHPDRTTPWLRIIRLAGVVGIAVTAVVHFFLLRPLLSLDGADWAADKLLHMVVPALALLVWVLAGPHPVVRGRDVVLAMAWPVAWLEWTLVVAQLSGWVPYPFLDAAAEGWGAVAVACVGVLALMLVVFGLVAWLDRRLPPSPRRT